ncbi:MAG: hypothetical protein WBO28_06990 [Flavobacteriales bacterium]|jgi:hypothetical protein
MEPLGWSGPDTTGILTPVLDAELEEYLLLAYMQRVQAEFRDRKLYPWLHEVWKRATQLKELQRRADQLSSHMPGELLGIDLEREQLLRAAPDHGRIAAMLASVERTLPELRTALDRGNGLREEYQSTIRCEPVGLLPLGAQEGWLLLRQGNEAVVYAYEVPKVRAADVAGAAHFNVRTRYCSTYTVGLGYGYGQIKAELARTGPMPNPAVFVFESTMTLPRIETFLPLAKQIAYDWAVGAGC